MKRMMLFVLVLALLVGCARQPEYGPAAVPRYLCSEGAVVTISDRATGEEWLVWRQFSSSTAGAVLLRHTGGTP